MPRGIRPLLWFLLAAGSAFGGFLAGSRLADPGGPLVDAADAASHLSFRPPVVRPGDDVAFMALEEHLARSGLRRVDAEAALAPGTWLAHEDRLVVRAPPFPRGLAAGSAGEAVRVTLHLDADGRVARIEDEAGRAQGEWIAPPERLAVVTGPAREDRDPVALHRVPVHLADAVLAVEDRRFFDHAGVDPPRIAAAAAANLRAGRIVEGGSTVTQQLVKNLHLSRERTFARKLREAVLALRVERRFAKDRILEAYLNEVYLGQRGAVAVHGVGAAARHWFGLDVAALGPAESALLAGLLRGPSLYDPRRHPERARARRDFVLRRLHQQGRLDDGALRRALASELGVLPVRRAAAAHATALLRREVAARYGSDALGREGLRVVSSLDARLQRAAERAVREGLAALEEAHPHLRREDDPLEGALVALDPRSGDLLALVGGRRRSSFDRAQEARRQPGSLMKPVVALAALSLEDEDGVPRYSLASRLRDAPLRVARPEGVWAPSNYDGRFRGRVTLADALERSLNVPMARLALEVGLDRVVATARALGIESPLAAVPSLALGAFEVSLLEITRAYGVLAADGVRAELRPVLVVLDRHGDVRAGAPVVREPVVPRRAAREVTRALRGAVERGTARRLRASGVVAPVAGKTGTTNDERDAWFVAYTPQLVVGVWVGFDDGRSLALTGGRAALPLAAHFLHAALPPGAEEDFPSETDPDGGRHGPPTVAGRAAVGGG